MPAPASNTATPRPSSTGSNAAGSKTAPATATGHSGSTSLQATSAVEPAGPSPLVGWGICLVALSVGAGVIAVRMRRS
jgi:hypothetical protein